jgi:hypothetical protein
MKHLFRILILSALCACAVHVSAETNSVAELEAWVAPRPLTSNEVHYAEFMVTGRNLIGGDLVHIIYPSASMIAPTFLMHAIVPKEDCLERGWPTDVDVTLHDVVISSRVISDEYTLFLMCAKDFGMEAARRTSMNMKQFEVFVKAVADYGFTEADFLNNDEATLVPSLEGGL